MRALRTGGPALKESASSHSSSAALLAEFGGNVLAGGVTDPKMIVAESFTLARDEIYAKAKPTAVPVFNNFVDLSPSECATRAPAEITSASVKGPALFDNADAKRIVRKRLFEAGARLANSAEQHLSIEPVSL